MTITHTKVSAVSDGGDSTKVQPSDWNAAHTIAAGYFLPRIATLTLTNAQIKDVNTPYVIIPATETLGYSGAPVTIPVPINVIVRLNNLAGGYANINADAQFQLGWGSDWSMDLMRVRAGSLDNAGVRVYFPQYFDVATQATNTPAEGVAHVHTTPPIIAGVNLSGNLEDNALIFALYNLSSGDLTDGHASNSIKVTVLYNVITL